MPFFDQIKFLNNFGRNKTKAMPETDSTGYWL